MRKAALLAAGLALAVPSWTQSAAAQTAGGQSGAKQPVGAPAAGAQSVATELAALFLRGCVPFAGNPARLRDWAIGQRLAIVPEPARAMFLNGVPGLVFDASTPVGKFVLVSSDDGLCSCITQAAASVSVNTALEDSLRAGGLRFVLVAERNDRAMAELRFREYVATLDQRVWRILAATVNDPNGGRAMLTAGPARAE